MRRMKVPTEDPSVSIGSADGGPLFAGFVPISRWDRSPSPNGSEWTIAPLPLGERWPLLDLSSVIAGTSATSSRKI